MSLFNKKKEVNQFVEDQKTLHENLAFAAKEQYKLLRANLAFTLPENTKCPIIGITSPNRGEGKSTTAVNLAYVLAESKKRVLLIDGDLRLPTIARKLRMNTASGLSNSLLGVEEHQISVYKSGLLDTLFVLPAGDLPPNPSELLGSRKMEKLLQILSEKFDYIIMDLPPVNIVSDALAVAHLITGLVFVVREDVTDRKSLEVCVRQLKLANVNVLGFVMTGSKTEKNKYYKGKKYYKKSYGYYSKSGTYGE